MCVCCEPTEVGDVVMNKKACVKQWGVFYVPWRKSAIIFKWAEHIGQQLIEFLCVAGKPEDCG